MVKYSIVNILRKATISHTSGDKKPYQNRVLLLIEAHNFYDYIPSEFTLNIYPLRLVHFYVHFSVPPNGQHRMSGHAVCIRFPFSTVAFFHFG